MQVFYKAPNLSTPKVFPGIGLITDTNSHAHPFGSLDPKKARELLGAISSFTSLDPDAPNYIDAYVQPDSIDDVLQDAGRTAQSRSLKSFGVVYDSTSAKALAKNNQALQDAADWAFAQINVQKLGHIIAAPRPVAFSATTVWRGLQSGGPIITSEVPVGGHPFNMPIAQFLWHGANDATMWFFEQCNKSFLNGLELEGRDIAGFCLNLSATKYGDPTTLKATSGIRITGCGFKHLRPGISGNACISLGTDPALTDPPGNTYQQSEVSFRDCDFVGESPGAVDFDWGNLQAACWKTQSGGNCKNFQIDGCSFAFARRAIDWGAASGDLEVNHLNIADCQTAVRQSDSQLLVRGGDIECNDTPDFRLLEGSGGGGACTAMLEGVQVFVFLAGALGKMIEWGGSLELRQCLLSNFNNSVSGGVIGNPWKMVVAGSVKSFGNTFYCPNGAAATKYAPYYDGSGNPYGPDAGSTFYTWGDSASVSSDADQYTTALDAGGGVHRLVDFSAKDGSQRSLSLTRGISLSVPAGTSVFEGKVGRAWHKHTVGFAAFQNTNTFRDVLLGIFQQNQRLRSFRADVTQAFAGLAGTIELRVGYDLPPGGTGGDDKVIADTDVKTAPVVIGEDPADLNPVAGGLGSAKGQWSGINPNPSGNWNLWARITSSVGNTTGLNAGSVTFEYETELL